MTEFSLARFSDIAVYANNSVINFNLVGEGYPGITQTDGGALECHTDDTTCCRGIDNPLSTTGTGEWYYPNGTVVPPPGSKSEFYRTRVHMVIRLNRAGRVTMPLGVYRCELPNSKGATITRYITLTEGDLIRWLCSVYCKTVLFLQVDVMTYQISIMKPPSLTLHLMMYQVLFLLVSDTEEP